MQYYKFALRKRAMSGIMIGKILFFQNCNPLPHKTIFLFKKIGSTEIFSVKNFYALSKEKMIFFNEVLTVNKIFL
jgi:hypothetical protein